ncbi:MAG: hypothetical protein AMXMBFR83_02550 [Phycisphaerae bacterium]
MDAATKNRIRERAGQRCEYCRLGQEDEPHYRFHIEHVVPRKHGGSDALTNLALACYHCNVHKGTNLTGIDPESGLTVPLFNPRDQVWDDHFLVQDNLIKGLSPVGRATVLVLNFNSPPRVELRKALAASL